MNRTTIVIGLIILLGLVYFDDISLFFTGKDEVEKAQQLLEQYQSQPAQGTQQPVQNSKYDLNIDHSTINGVHVAHTGAVSDEPYSAPVHGKRECPSCDGSGKEIRHSGGTKTWVRCNLCHGSGQITDLR